MSYHHLTMDERNVIYRMQFQGYGQVEIARCLGRHRSTISRECKRNGNVEGRYDPGNAQTLAHGGQPTHAPRRLGRRYGGRQRPPGILADLCVDRASRYLIARKLQACAAQPVAEQLQRTIRRLPVEKRRSLTLDNSREFARPIQLEKKLDLPIYFAHPYHSWERGTNENTNGLLRQYLPKGTDLANVTDRQLQAYVCALNHRPRKCLGFQSPFEVFHAKPSR